MELIHTAWVPPGDGPFPTLVALHGWGASAVDLLGLAPHVAGGRLLTLCPQGATELRIAPGALGYGWFPLVQGKPPDPRTFLKASAQLRAFIDEARRRYPVDPARTVALGFSQGGVMAIDLALRETEAFAGLVVLSSWFPAILAANLPRKAAQKGFPVLLIHGSQDRQASVEQARESRAVFESFGVDLSFHELPMGHEVNAEAIGTLVRWLREKVLR